MVAEECRNCHVPNRYIPSAEAQFLRQYAKTNVTLDNKDYLRKTQFRQRLFKDSFSMKLPKYHRETSFESIVAANYKSSVGFRSKFDGYLGLAPYTSDPNNKDRNFLQQLRKEGVIDHNVFAIDVRQDGNSTIKFGSWDLI